MKDPDYQKSLEFMNEKFKCHDDLMHDQVIRVIVSDSDTPGYVLRTIAAITHDNDLLKLIAANPNTPNDLLRELATHGHKSIRMAVAENTNVSISAVKPLAADDSPSIRFTVASNPFMPENVLNDLTEDENPFVAVKAKETIERVRNELEDE